MKLPSAEVEIDEQKVRGYLLSPTHAVGRFKARVFSALGFDQTTPLLRRSAVLPWLGRKYTVPGDLKGPAGSAQVLTVWIQEAGQVDVRIVTVRPR